jgi:pyruvate formate lyase activating enzyme
MTAADSTLEAVLAARTGEAASELVEKLDRNWVRCYACSHLCKIPPGHVGICKIRYNQEGVLRVPRGYVAALQLDPIEKKPFFHAYPGASAMSFGMLGCDYHCGYCQNWITSQALRDQSAGVNPMDVEPIDLVRLAQRYGARVITSTYNEPLITSEWAVEVFKVAKEHGLVCSYVSNGNGTPQVLDFLQPYVDLYKVDLKGFSQKHYRELGGRLEPVLETIKGLKERGIWLEVLTLVIPGFNDSEEELTQIAEFLAGVSPEIPWHVTAFHKDYKMTENDNTDAKTLRRAYEVGRRAGLHYVYPGNIPGAFGDLEGTHCPGCNKLLIGRVGFKVLSNRITPAGTCPDCGRVIPGVWN